MADKYPTIGELRNRVGFLVSTKTENDQYRMETTWNEAFPAWAKIEASSGLRFSRDDAARADVTHKITMRYRDDVTRDMVIKTSDDICFKIHKIVIGLQGNKRFLIIHSEQIDLVL